MKNIASEAAQVCISSSHLWNVSYSGILRMKLLEDMYLIWYSGPYSSTYRGSSPEKDALGNEKSGLTNRQTQSWPENGENRNRSTEREKNSKIDIMVETEIVTIQTSMKYVLAWE